MKYISLKDIEEVGVSHNPKIKKKVLIANGQIPHLTQFSRAKLTLGQIADAHIHPDMYEIFNVESGEGVIIINNKRYELTVGVCVVVEPGEKHGVTNTGKEDLLMTMVGIKA